MMRALLAWLVILPLMVINGIFREVALVPGLDRTAADIVSAALGIIIILLVTRPFLRRLHQPTTRHLVTISAAWLILTVAFEFLFGHYVDRKSWAELAGNYALWRGKLWPIVLASLVAAPFIWTTRRA